MLLISGLRKDRIPLHAVGFWVLGSAQLLASPSLQLYPKELLWGVVGCDGQGSGGDQSSPTSSNNRISHRCPKWCHWAQENPSHHGPGVSYLCTQTFSSLLSLTTEQHLQFSHQARGHHVIFGLSLSFPPNPPALPKHRMLPESPSSAFPLVWGCCSEVFSLEG